MPSRSYFIRGALAALPVVLGYIPVGIAFGVLARQGGLSILEAAGMSLLVYAGASQFIAVEMLSGGALIIPVILTTLLVNLRHLLMSSAIVPHLGKLNPAMVLMLSAQLTDESFAVAMAGPEKIEGRPHYLLGLQMVAHSAWVGGTLIGAVFGTFVNGSAFGFPFALPALFICLLVLQLKTRIHYIVMLLSGVSALVFKAVLPGNWYILLAAVVAAACGFLLFDREQKTGGMA